MKTILLLSILLPSSLLAIPATQFISESSIWTFIIGHMILLPLIPALFAARYYKITTYFSSLLIWSLWTLACIFTPVKELFKVFQTWQYEFFWALGTFLIPLIILTVHAYFKTREKRTPPPPTA